MIRSAAPFAVGLATLMVAAPALGFTFAPSGLSKVKVPIQLWRAEQDSILPHPDYAEGVRAFLEKRRPNFSRTR